MSEYTAQSNYHILISLIEIWPYEKGTNPMLKPDNVTMLTEVESISIEDDYKELICGASVKFPRGTILRKTLTSENGLIYDNNVKATLSPDGVLQESTNTSPYKINEKGEKETIVGAKLAEVTDFKVGDRIRISIGYTEDPIIAESAQYHKNRPSIHTDYTTLINYRKALTTMFDGYITKVSLDTPIELECENLASALKGRILPNRPGKKGDTVNLFLSSKAEGGMNLLEGSGLTLHPLTERTKISLGPVSLSDNWTVADMLDIWAQRKVYSFVKTEGDTPYLAVGRAYFSNQEGDSILKLGETNFNIPVIDFGYHVAKNDLTLMSTDKNFLAVEAQCLEKGETDKNGFVKEKFYKVVVAKNPDYDAADPKSEKYRILNETKTSKKMQKAGKRILSTDHDKVDLDKYTVIPYMSPKFNCDRKELEKEAIKYLESYNPNGIEGSLTLFGDLQLRAGSKVSLRDNIHSAKNGEYIVDEVKTEFGVSGYRQTIKLPYCIRRDNQQNTEQ